MIQLDSNSYKAIHKVTGMELLNTKEVAKILKTTPGNVRQMVLRKKIRARKMGRRLVYSKKDILEFIENLPVRGKR